MQAFASSISGSKTSGSRLSRGPAVVAGGLAASALLAITAATALPSGSPSSRAAAAPAFQQKTMVAIAQRTLSAASTGSEGDSRSDPAIRRFTGRVGADLSDSLTAAGVPERQAREYVWLLAKAIDIQDGLSVDDRFDLILQRNPENGGLGELLYAGMDRVARSDIELMKWTDGRHVVWVNGDGTADDADQAMRMPVAGHLTSGFGERFHPILGYERFHAGVDLGAAAGTPIVAAADGKVLSAGWAGGYGRAVAILHSGGIETKYGHMSRIAAHPGEQVHRGDIIGYVGSSGLSTGPHLHFEVIKNGRPVNPLSVKEIAGGPGQLEGQKLVAFQNELRGLLLAGSGA